MLRVTPQKDRIKIGDRFAVSFQRTVRVPDDDKDYPLPPGLAEFPIYTIKEFKNKVPAVWDDPKGVFIPMHQREAMWLAFEAAYWKPNAVKVGIGKMNAIDGKHWKPKLHAGPQDYVVCPNQPWLDGFNAGHGMIRQFVAMPVGSGYTVEGQLSAELELGGIRIVVYEPKKGTFPDQPPEEIETESVFGSSGMGLAAGGKIRQKIYPDPYGIQTWDQENFGAISVHIVNAEQFHEITGRQPPPSPITAETYTRAGLPWFDLDDKRSRSLPAPDSFKKIKSTALKDKEKDDAKKNKKSSAEKVTVRPSHIKKLHHGGLDRKKERNQQRNKRRGS